MTYGEFKDMLIRAMGEVGFQARKNGQPVTGSHPLEWWLNVFHEHRESDHSAGGDGLKRGDKVTLK